MTTLIEIAKPMRKGDMCARITSGRCGAVLSKSGKAVLLPRPRHSGEFWCPVSMLRLGRDDGMGDFDICVPQWFLMRNRIEF